MKYFNIKNPIVLFLLMLLPATILLTNISSADKNSNSRELRYLKLDINGQAIAEKLGAWACVLDQQTNLVWEVKSPQEDIHHSKSMYSWFDENTQQGIKNTGTCHSGTELYSCDSEHLKNISNRQNYCGLSNWRLPSTVELQSILYRDAHPGRALTDPFLFPRTYIAPYWTSDIVSPNTDIDGILQLKTVHFGSGDVGKLNASRSAPIRLVASINSDS